MTAWLNVLPRNLYFSHIEILQILIFLTNVTPIISCGIDKAHEGLELKL